MSDQNKDFQNQNGSYPNYGQPVYYQAPPMQQGQPMPQGQPVYYQAPPMQQGQPMPQGQPVYYQVPPMQQGQSMPQGQPVYYQAPPMQQGQPMPQGQPVYYQAPPMQQGQPMPQRQPVYYQAPTTAPISASDVSAEPEVILQTPTFEDYGFSADDSLDSGHDFGGFMMDDNTLASEPNTNIFNAPTPNLDLAEVEANASKKDDNDAAMFNTPTPNLDINSVELAAKTTTESDREAFSNPMPVMSVEAEPVAAEPTINFMASMQSMFSSMTGTTDPIPSAPIVAPIPATEPSDVSVATPSTAYETQPEVHSEEPVISHPDTVVGDKNSDANVIQDISSTSPDEGKGPEYWDYMNHLLNKFDDGQVHTGVGSQAVNSAPETVVNDLPFTPAPPIEAEPIPVQVNAQPEPEVKSEPVIQVVDVPISPKANIIRDVSAAPVQAPIDDTSVLASAVAAATIPLADEPIASNVEMEEIDDKTLKKMEKAKKAEEKAAAKAAKAEAKAAAKAEKAAAKAAKKNQDAEMTENVSDEQLDAEEISKAKRILGAVFPKKGDPKSEIIRKIVLIVAAIVFIGCMIKLGFIYMGTRENAQASQELSAMMATGESAESDWSTIYNKYPDVTFPVGMQTKFADLYALNNDLVGWIRIPGLDIDYPVVQTDDDSYYLKRDYKGNKSDYGTIFVGASNNIETLDQNTVVYGHSMRRDVQMFAALKEYKSIEGFKNNPIIEFNTLYGDYKFKVYAVFISNGSTAGDNGYVFQYTTPNLSGIEAFAGFIDQLNQRTLYYTGVDIQPDDKLITLSTCTYEFDNGRLAVVGRLIREGESEEVDVSKATVNPNPRYPQAWYDKNNQTNPYQTYANWVPTPAN